MPVCQLNVSNFIKDTLNDYNADFTFPKEKYIFRVRPLSLSGKGKRKLVTSSSPKDQFLEVLCAIV